MAIILSYSKALPLGLDEWSLKPHSSRSISDFVTNGHGESSDSFCEKKKMSPSSKNNESLGLL